MVGDPTSSQMLGFLVGVFVGVCVGLSVLVGFLVYKIRKRGDHMICKKLVWAISKRFESKTKDKKLNLPAFSLAYASQVC